MSTGYSASPSECCSWLAEGKIDLFGSVSYKPELAEKPAEAAPDPEAMLTAIGAVLGEK